MKEKTKLYDCEVRLGGDVTHTIPRKGITDREIRVLRALHGNDGVANVVEAGEGMVDQKEELFDLAVKYSKTMNPMHGRGLIERVFNTSLDGFDRFLADREELRELERQEDQQRRQKEAAMFDAARVAAEARVRADIAARTAEQVAA